MNNPPMSSSLIPSSPVASCRLSPQSVPSRPLQSFVNALPAGTAEESALLPADQALLPALRCPQSVEHHLPHSLTTAPLRSRRSQLNNPELLSLSYQPPIVQLARRVLESKSCSIL